MRWFPKKSIPWDGPFRIHTEVPGPSSMIAPDHFRFQFPYNYYAQLLYITHDLALTASLVQRWWHLDITRGGYRIATVLTQIHPLPGSFIKVAYVVDGWSIYTRVLTNDFLTHMMSSHLYFMPFDTIDIYSATADQRDVLSNFVLTYKQWMI